MMARKSVPFTESLAAEYEGLWDQAKIKPGWVGAFDRAANYALKHKARYQRVSYQTGVPWELIAALHWRESTGSFKRHLHNGDPLTRRTTHVPRGRPLGIPPFTWEESAIDALEMKGLHRIKDWSRGRMAYEAERFNGWGYRLFRGHRSPYLWSGTQLYRVGKYEADGVYNALMVDKQPGVIPLMKRIRELDAHEEVVKKSHELTMGRRVVTAIKALFAAISAVISSIFSLETLGIVKEWWYELSDFLAPEYMLALGISALAIYTVIKWHENLTVEKYKEGRYTPSGMCDEPDCEHVDEHFDGAAADPGYGADESLDGWEDQPGGAGGPGEDGPDDLPGPVERPAVGTPESRDRE